ncbi:MAG: O-antigen ligase family protein [Candidatus Binatia bacterium]
MDINSHQNKVSQGALLLVQGTGLLLLTLFLFQIFSTGKAQVYLWAVLAGLGTLVVLHKPAWGVLILMMVWFSDFSPRVLGIRFLSVPYVVVGVLLIPLALSILRDRVIWFFRVPQVKIFLLIGTLLLASTWWNDALHPLSIIPELDSTERMLHLFFARLLFLVFFIHFITTRGKIELALFLAVAMIIIAAHSALPIALSGGRARASFSLAANPNRLAFICLFATCLIWFYRSSPEARLKPLTLPLLFFLPAVALATGSRSGFIQMIVLGILILKEQEGWSAIKRIHSFLFLGAVLIFLSVMVPASQYMRATSFDPTTQAPGKQSMDKRITRIWHLLETAASNPVFGIGVGNFRWVNQSRYGDDRQPHNSYLGTLAESGVAVLALYLLLFYFTYRMLNQLKRSGPREFLWLSKGLRVNLILFLVFSVFADFWLNDFLYLIIGLTVAMTVFWQRQEVSAAKLRPRSVLVPTPVGLSA